MDAKLLSNANSKLPARRFTVNFFYGFQLAGPLMSLLIFQSAFAGGSGWNGGAEGPLPPSAQQVAWFVTDTTENREVTYCTNSTKLRGPVKRAFDRWSRYIQEKHLNIRPSSKLTFASRIRSLNALATCEGNEDLRVEVGTLSHDIDQEKKKYIQPVGFSKRGIRDQNSEAPWFNQSLIWINDSILNLGFSENVSLRLLEIILTHELGHAFGNDHVQGTIMDVQIGEIIMRDLPKNKKFRALTEKDQLTALEGLLEIDQQKTLVLSRFTNTFPVTFFPGKLSTTEIESAKRFNNHQQLILKESILPRLFGISLGLGEYTPALNGIVSLKQAPTGTYSLHTFLSGKKPHLLELGKPLKPLAISEESSQQRAFRIEGQPHSFASEAKVLVFRMQVTASLELPVYIYLNAPGSLKRAGRFTLEIGDPAEEDSSWILLLDQTPPSLLEIF